MCLPDVVRQSARSRGLDGLASSRGGMLGMVGPMIQRARQQRQQQPQAVKPAPVVNSGRPLRGAWRNPYDGGP